MKAFQNGADVSCYPNYVILTSKEEIEKQNYIFIGDRYKAAAIVNSLWPIVELGEVCEIIAGQSPEGKFYNEKW